MIRAFGVLALIALGCGKGDDRKQPAVEVLHDAARPLDGPSAAPPLGALDGRIPRLAGDAVMPLAPPPIAVVLIGEDRRLRVAASGGSWAQVTAADFADGDTEVASIAELPAALLTILDGAGGPAAEAARAMRAELAAGDAEEPEDEVDAGGGGGFGYGLGDQVGGLGSSGWGGEQEVSVTYAAEPGAALPAATPLVIAHPGAPGGFVAEVVDRVGGALAVAHGTTVRVFRLGFPWEHAGYGGATLPGDDEAPSVDVHLDGPELMIGSESTAISKLAIAPIDPAALHAELERHATGATVPALPPTTIDLIVPDAIEVQGLLDILAAVDGATGRRIGVAASPWGLLGPDPGGWGTIGIGRYGTSSGWESATGEGGRRSGKAARDAVVPLTRLGAPIVVGALDKAVIRRYLRRNLAKLAYCYEKQLLAKPALVGTVMAKLVIAETGLVVSVTAEGVSPEVSSCVAGVIKSIEFPKPKKGIVQITQPITYAPTGG